MAPTRQQDQTARTQLRTALRARGYSAIGQYSIAVSQRIETVFTLWSKGTHQVLMETITWADGSTHCDLYQPLTQHNDLAATIAAIP